MASECPCGCGRRLKWAARRMAKRVVKDVELLSWLQIDGVAVYVALGQDRLPLDQFLADGEQVLHRLLAMAHGELPSDSALQGPLNAWEKSALGMLGALQETSAARSSPAPPPPPESLAAQPDWYPDPWEQARLRYWDGQQWTGHTSA
jgi:Protein of unknown function (DUF2510)